MKDRNILNKTESKRGRRVYCSLSEKAKLQHQLRILKVDGDFEKRKSLYQILLYFHSFKRGDLLSKRQLNNRLSKMGLRFEDLKAADLYIVKSLNGMTWDFDSASYTQVAAYTTSLNNISVVKYVSESKKKRANKKVLYYLFVPGFTKDEFITSIRQLKKGKEPRPFSKYHPLVPHVRYKNYTDADIKEAIKLFHSAGLIKPISSVYLGESRFYLSNEWLVGFINIIRQIQNMIFTLIITKLANFQRITDLTYEDREFLQLFLGEKGTNFAERKAHVLRKDPRKINTKNIDREVADLETKINLLIYKLKKDYGNLLKSNELLVNLVYNFDRYSI